MHLISRLNDIISEWHLLKHNFYQSWNRGEITKPVLQRYAMEYQSQVDHFPRFLSRIHSYCDQIDARKKILENLIDEELHGKDHPTLWSQFATGLGVTQDEMKKNVLLPETKAMIDTFYALANRDWRDGLCALYAYEKQVPDVAYSKMKVKDQEFTQFYAVQQQDAMEFFTAHMEYDVEHSNQVAELIERYVEPERAEKATREAAQALWKFLDGMCRVGNIQCEMIN